MFDILIFSKNRAMQLLACIRSVRRNIPQIAMINVLYVASDDFFQKGYDRFMAITNNDKNIICHKQFNFEEQTKSIINKTPHQYHMCLADDDISINPVTHEELKPILNGFTDNVVAVSFHYNKNITYCGSANTPIVIPPSLIIQPTSLYWNWTENDGRYDWGYPHHLGNLYKTIEFQNLINPLHFSGPNELEGQMNNHRNYSKPFMRSFVQSKFFNVSNNYVKSEKNDPKYDIQDTTSLNKRFLDGYIINIDVLQHIELNRMHGAFSYVFKPLP